MMLRRIWLDRKLLRAHGNLTQDLEECLARAEEQGLGILDIGGFTEEQLRTKAKESLLIADCRSTEELGVRLGAATLGYERQDAALNDGKEESRKEESRKEKNPGELLHTQMVVQGFEEIDSLFFNRVYERFHGLPWKIAETERLLIREFVREDAQALSTVLDNLPPAEVLDSMPPAEVLDNMPPAEAGIRTGAEELDNYIRHQYRFYGYGMWAVVMKESGRLIGTAGIYDSAEGAVVMKESGRLIGTAGNDDSTEGAGCQEIGYALDPAFRGMGYAAEAVSAVLSYARDRLELSGLFCRIRRDNTPSLHLAEKVGFTRAKEECAEQEEQTGRAGERDCFLLFISL